MTVTRFEYGQNGQLIKIETYINKNDRFVFTSMNSFEYNGELIDRKNLHNELRQITQFHAYEYDKNGNVKNEKYYSHLFTNNAEPKIISENSFKYDNKKNPFVIFMALGNPGLYSNTNNVIEGSSILYEDAPGIPRNSTSKTSYKYNLNDYPVKVIRESDEYEYTY